MKESVKDLEKAWEDPSLFAHHVLGLSPYKYQHMILRNFRQTGLNYKRLIICKSRQIGLSYCLACLSIWFVITKQKTSGVHNDTKVGIISRDDKASKKLMSLIQKFIFSSSENLDVMVKGGRGNPLNKSEIHFDNGFIKCYPPTDACRGESFDLLIVDEAAFVDDDIFKDAMEPTVSHTDGIIILSSTPKGQSGFFFEFFDPYDTRKSHEYKRYWFHWRMCENQVQYRLIERKMKEARETGSLKSFDQEYNALFTADEESFFDDIDVENGIDKNIEIKFESKKECGIGVDYGGVSAYTVISVVEKEKDSINLVYQYAKKNMDLNLLNDEAFQDSFPNLKKRYPNASVYVTDDCAAGMQLNQWLENEGYPLQRFNFRSDQVSGFRSRGFYLFRSWLKKGQIKYPEIRQLIAEMKTVQEVKMEVYTRIKAPRNYHDDRIDSLMMACYPFLVDDSNFKSKVIDYSENIKEKQKKYPFGRVDPEWEKIKLEGVKL